MSDDAVKQMKQAVAKAAADRVQSGMIVGLGTGSTTAFVIQFLGDRLRNGELSNIAGVPTSFQASVLAKKYGIPLVTLDDVEKLDIAIDGADEVDPAKNLIKGVGQLIPVKKLLTPLRISSWSWWTAANWCRNWVPLSLCPWKCYPLPWLPSLVPCKLLGGSLNCAWG